jgi:hypothetical protein
VVVAARDPLAVLAAVTLRPCHPAEAEILGLSGSGNAEGDEREEK